MAISNFSKGPLGSYTQQLGLMLDGRDPTETIQDITKKRMKNAGKTTPNNYSPYNPLSTALLNTNGNQY